MDVGIHVGVCRIASMIHNNFLILGKLMIRNVCVFIFLSCLSLVHADPESDQLARIIYKESMIYKSAEESIQTSLQSEPLVNLSQEEKVYYKQKTLDPKAIEEAYT